MIEWQCQSCKQHFGIMLMCPNCGWIISEDYVKRIRRAREILILGLARKVQGIDLGGIIDPFDPL